MKPRTRLHKRVERLSKKLPKATKQQMEWAEEELFNKHYHVSRNRVYCLECGTKWNPDVSKMHGRIIGYTCPACQSKLIQRKDYRNNKWDAEYWSIITTVNGFQVVRMFWVKKIYRVKHPVKYQHAEVMQHWIGSDGSYTLRSMLTHAMGHYYVDQWIMGSKLTLREHRTGDISRVRTRIAPHKIWKYSGILQKIRRNGFDGNYYGWAPQVVFYVLLNYPKAETLLKAGQIGLFDECMSMDWVTAKSEKVEQYWPSIRIAMRNNYFIGHDTDDDKQPWSASDWFDMLRWLEREGKDLRNPKYICPDHFWQAHNYWMDRHHKRVIAEAETKRRENLRQAEKEYASQKWRYMDLCFMDPDIGLLIRPIQSVEEFLLEGDAHHHCVGKSAYYRKKDELVFTAQIKGIRTETVSFCLQDFRVKQARGLQNKTTKYHDAIMDLVNAHADLIRRIKNARPDEIEPLIEQYNNKRMVA